MLRWIEHFASQLNGTVSTFQELRSVACARQDAWTLSGNAVASLSGDQFTDDCGVRKKNPRQRNEGRLSSTCTVQSSTSAVPICIARCTPGMARIFFMQDINKHQGAANGCGNSRDVSVADTLCKDPKPVRGAPAQKYGCCISSGMPTFRSGPAERKLE